MKDVRGRRAAFVIAAGFALAAAATGVASADARLATTEVVDLGRAISLELAAGESLTLRGEVVTRHDGVRYDATTRWSEEGPRLGGLVATDGTGLRVARQERGNVALEATGEDAPTCRALGLAAPCLVPRTTALAHERLLTAEDFAGTLSGKMVMELSSPSRPVALVPWRRVLVPLAIGSVLVALAGALVWLQAMRSRPLARVDRAAREANRGIAGLPSAPALRIQIASLVRHARTLVAAERRASTRLAADLQRARPAREALGAMSEFAAREASELDRLRGERDRARHGLVEIEAALRVLALHGVGAEESIEDTERALARLGDELAINKTAANEAADVLRGIAER